jgi:hypothetical protein
MVRPPEINQFLAQKNHKYKTIWALVDDDVDGDEEDDDFE